MYGDGVRLEIGRPARSTADRSSTGKVKYFGDSIS